jgi:hypothetical protein
MLKPQDTLIKSSAHFSLSSPILSFCSLKALFIVMSDFDRRNHLIIHLFKDFILFRSCHRSGIKIEYVRIRLQEGRTHS